MKLKDYIFPFPTLYSSSNTINKKIYNLIESNCDTPYCYEYSSSNKGINIDILLNILKDTIDNKKTLEDKAKSTLIAITISITLIINLLNFIKNIENNSTFLMGVLVILGIVCVFYMIMAGVLSLYSISEINTVANMFPEDYLLPDEEKRLQISDNIEYNYLNNLKRNNFMTTSYKCMISSISILLIIYIISTFSFAVEKNNTTNQELYNDVSDIKKAILTILEEYPINNQSQITMQQGVETLLENDKIIDYELDHIKITMDDIYILLKEKIDTDINEFVR